jgi:DNA-binding MarR family transcriptional regulator
MKTELEPNSVDLLIAQVCRRHYRRAHDLLEEIGLYRGQPPVLRALWADDGRTHSELADRLHVRRATITKMITRMEEAGFVERRKDVEDRRVSRVYLTAAGRAIQERVQEVWRRLEGEVLAGFTPRECDLLRGFLTRIRDNLEAIEKHSDKE